MSNMKTSLAAGLFAALSLIAMPAQAQFGLFKSALVKGDEAYEREDFEAALKHYTKAAKKDEAEAQFKLGRLYERGEGTEADPAEALIWYTRAAEQGLDMAQTNLGVLYDTGRGTEEDNVSAARWFREAARQGNPVAQYNLALMLHQGDGIPQNKAQAAALYGRAAEQGVPLAFLPHAELLSELGRYDLAFASYQRAEDAGSIEAAYRKGVLLHKGLGVEADPAAALLQYTKAADAGLPLAQQQLGVMTTLGDPTLGLQSDPETGIALLERAGEQGFAPALMELAYLYDGALVIDGKTLVEKDEQLSLSYLVKAAQVGNALAQNAAGERILMGVGVDTDPVGAVDFFIAAARQNYPNAFFNLGQMHQTGIGLEQNLEEAAKLYAKALELGVEEARQPLVDVCANNAFSACFLR
ncbi:MAG: hypothetical protein CMM68_04745 [Rhodospirillaceae bacterium]|nr:hypothetical protein [Rhodospirillaceae bacterium]